MKQFLCVFLLLLLSITVMSNKKALTKYLKNINPKTMNQWCFVDDEGNISGRVAEFLLNPTDSFKVTIKFELPDEEESEV